MHEKSDFDVQHVFLSNYSNGREQFAVILVLVAIPASLNLFFPPPLALLQAGQAAFPFLPERLERTEMGEWKAQISLRVRQDLRRELEGVAERERRKLGNVAEALLEWAALQLRVAGSVERLMKVQLTNKKENR